MAGVRRVKSGQDWIGRPLESFNAMALMDLSSKEEEVDAGVSRDDHPGRVGASSVEPSLFTLPEEDPASTQNSLPTPVEIS